MTCVPLSGSVFPAGVTTTVTCSATDAASNAGSASFTAAVAAYIDQAPIVTNPGPQASAEGASVSLQIVASDADGDTLTYSATGLPTGLAIGSGTGRITGTVAYGAAPSNNVVVTVSDGILTSAPATVSITVTPVNDAPVAFDDHIKAKHNVPYNGTLTATDVDNKNLVFNIVSQPTRGTLVLSSPSTGTHTYTATSKNRDADSFTFRV